MKPLIILSLLVLEGCGRPSIRPRCNVYIEKFNSYIKIETWSEKGFRAYVFDNTKEANAKCEAFLKEEE